MQLNLSVNQDLATWIEANRGDCSRAKFVILMLRKCMQETNLMEDYQNDTTSKIPVGNPISTLQP